VAVVAVTHGREIHAARRDLRLHAGERVLVLVPAASDEHGSGSSAADRADRETVAP
jgi:hypothetical protein